MSQTIDSTHDPHIRRDWTWRILQMLAAILVRVMFDLKVRNRHVLPKTGGVLVVSNHQSYLDPVLLAVLMHRPFAYLADAYLFKIKPFAWLIRKLNAFPVKQGSGDVGAMKQTIKLLQEGWVLNIFPEGHRTHHGRLLPVQPGVALVVRRAKVPVVPAIIYGAYDAWPRHQVAPKFGRIRVIYRPSIDMSKMSPDEIVQTLTTIFNDMFEEARQWDQQLRGN